MKIASQTLWKGDNMDKLSPKPSHKKLSKGWEDLNDLLLANFENFNAQSATISLEDYAISKDEIISEATSKGYKVIDDNNGYLTFE